MNDDLFEKRIVIVGLARQGKALAKFAVSAGAHVVASDLMSPAEGTPIVGELGNRNIEYVFGEHPLSLLDDADFLAPSGGVPETAPIVIEAQKRLIPITNDSLEFIKRVKAPVIGITGSAGKTTTTALTGAIAKASGKTTWVGGNIGRPLISELDNIAEDDVVVQELSSFQLVYWTKSPSVSAILNITPNHLDRHGSMEAYSSAKANILRYQGSSDTAVLSRDDAGAAALKSEVRGRLREFSLKEEVQDGAFIRDRAIWLRDGEEEELILNVEEIPLRGAHNVKNVLAAAVLADTVGISAEAISAGVHDFQGVEHRLEIVRTINGIQFVNDSIATAPERAIAAIDSFEEPIILLAGGRDKDMVWEAWAQRVLARVKVAVLFGDLSDLMARKLKEGAAQLIKHSSLVISRKSTLEEALDEARIFAEPGDVILLSPGGTSFDAYKDFAERGEAFKDLVNSIRAD
ncbi:MAG: UDP-N-acetylmuramoyl-L-alanine--D-glutamate ligase [Candidatus Promineifilaceae bacterium]